MNVSCPECRSVFRVDPAKITSVSMRARCSVCGGLIAVGAAVKWEDDSGGDFAALSAAPRGAAQVAVSGGPFQGSTPTGVRPVLARAEPPVPTRSGQPSVPPTASTPVRSTPWGTPQFPADKAPAPGPSRWEAARQEAPANTPPQRAAAPRDVTPQLPPAVPTPSSAVSIAEPVPPPRPQPTPVEPGPSGADLAEPFVRAPLGTPFVSEGAQRDHSRTPTYSTLDDPEDRDADPLAVTPRRFEVMGGAAAPRAVEPEPVPDESRRSFGAPLTPPARTSIPAPAPAPSAPAPTPSPRPVAPDASLAFSARSTPAAPSTAVPAQRRPINPFLANDPNQKARRLARALVSDMVAYHPTRREEGLENGTLKQLFRDEIKKSYEEYVEQVGREFAESTAHFQEALNDVLAGGRKMF